MNQKAQVIVEAVLEELKGRSGFDSWWYDIDDGIQEEIMGELVNAVEEELTKE